MRRFWIVMNMIYEKFMLGVFIFALLIVAYGLYDSWYVYNKAGDDSYLKYKPVAGKSVPVDSPITDDTGRILTIRLCRATRIRTI